MFAFSVPVRTSFVHGPCFAPQRYTRNLQIAMPTLRRRAVQRPFRIQASVEQEKVHSNIRCTVLPIVGYLATAAVFLAFVEGWTLLDALYFAVVTATTVGYVR